LLTPEKGKEAEGGTVMEELHRKGFDVLRGFERS